jgi:hypothetical protein
MTTIIEDLNNLRLKNKDQWVFYSVNYNKYIIQIKSYNTWIQIFQVRSDLTGYIKLKDNSAMNLNASQFKKYIADKLKYIKTL